MLVEQDKNYLIDGLRIGDRHVIKEIYNLYFPSISKYIYNNSGNEDDAMDIFQDGLMVIYNKTKNTEFTLEHGFHTYLYSICRNTWLKKIKNKSRNEVSFDERIELIDSEFMEKELIWREKEILYQEKFKELGDGCQKVLKMALKGISMIDIAKNMGYGSPGYAKKRKYKCKNQLMKLIQADKRYLRLTSI